MVSFDQKKKNLKIVFNSCVYSVLVLMITRAFDVEMLYIAEKLNMSLAEVAVNWTEIEGKCIYSVNYNRVYKGFK